MLITSCFVDETIATSNTLAYYYYTDCNNELH